VPLLRLAEVGEWEGLQFVIKDGRHAFVAALMIGHEDILVAWLKEEGS
jgi:hypothetical protein